MSDNTNDKNIKADHPTTIKDVEIKAGSKFEANGKNYTVSETFSIGRFSMVTLLEEELSMLSDRDSCHQSMVEAMELINNYKPGDAYTTLYNKIKSDNKSELILPFTLRLCAAYINHDDEDISCLTDEQIKSKIDDWAAEGLDVRPFLIFALSVFKELIVNYKQPIVNILQQTQSVADVINEKASTETDT